ncbi:type 4a pilus biogenesis protein PilO [Paractinoplanes rishiriensis]|nr:type 4a pilus biogenesis protein PilO [Actinoplanes rishiriensis]
MSSRHASRMLLAGGVLVIVILVVATYLLAIKPVYDDKALKETQVSDADLELTKLRRQLADLKVKSADAATYTAELKAKKTQLPDSYDIPNLLRQLQTSDTSVKVDNNAVGVTTPVTVAGSGIVVGVPITLTATGNADGLSKFVNRLQNTQSRAVLVSAVNLQVDGNETTLTTTLTAFCSKSDDDDCKVNEK